VNRQVSRAEQSRCGTVALREEQRLAYALFVRAYSRWLGQGRPRRELRLKLPSNDLGVNAEHRSPLPR
jgi:hypothetical protein